MFFTCSPTFAFPLTGDLLRYAGFGPVNVPDSPPCVCGEALSVDCANVVRVIPHNTSTKNAVTIFAYMFLPLTEERHGMNWHSKDHELNLVWIVLQILKITNHGP